MLKIIGKVKKVFLNKIVVTLNNKEDFFQLYNGDVYLFEGINQYIIVKKNEYEKLIFQTICLYEDENPYTLEESSKFKSDISLEAVPIGTMVNNNFEFGITTYPMISDEVEQISNIDLENIFSIINSDKYIQIGELNQFKGYFPKIGIDKLFSAHMCILGNTGSGKSTTIRNILDKLCSYINDELINRNFNFYIFDVHNEYNISDKVSNKVSVNDIVIPVENLTKEDWINLVIPSSATQLPVLINSLKLGYLLKNDERLEKAIRVYLANVLYNGQQTDAVTKRTKIVNLLSNIDNELDEILSRYNVTYGNFKDDYEINFKNKLKSLFEEYIKNTNISLENDNHNFIIDKILELAECKIDDIRD